MSNYSAALMAMFDGSGAFAGATVATRGTANLVIPAITSQSDSGRYADPLAFLTGYGCQLTMWQDLATSWVTSVGGGALPTDVSVGFTNDDLMYVYSETITFSLTAAVGNVCGFPAGTTAASAQGTGYAVTATSPWTRGSVTFTSTLVNTLLITPDGKTAFQLPAASMRVHSIPTWMRGAEGDADDVTGYCVEHWDNDAADNTYRRLRWGIDSTGRVWTSWPTAVTDLAWPNTAESKAFRLALGFTGSETPVTVDGADILTATYRCPRVLIIRRGLAQWDATLQDRAGVVELADGSVRGRPLTCPVEFECRFFVDGSTGLYPDEGDMLRTLGPALTRGSRCSIHPHWGDPRLGKAVAEVRNGTVPYLYTHSATTEMDGLLGRRVGRVSPNSPDTRRWIYNGENRHRSEQVVILRETPR